MILSYLYRVLILSIILFTGLASCDKERDSELINNTFKIDTEQLFFPGTGGKKEVVIQCGAKPCVSVSEAWLEISEIASPVTKTEPYKVTVSVSANPAIDSRAAEISVTSGKNSGVIKVTQEGTGLKITDDNLTDKVIGMEGESVLVSFATSGSYEVTTSRKWIAATETDKDGNNVTLKVMIGFNLGEAREGTVSIASGGVSISFPVRQEAFSGVPDDNSGMESTAWQLAKKLGPGFNIGNTFDSHPNGETSWGNPVVNRQFIKGLADAGVGTVRLPVTWYQFADEVYTISPAAMERIREVVDWILEEGMYVIINTHHDDVIWLKALGLSDTRIKNIDDQFRTYWAQIAVAFRDYDERVIFAGLNEPEPGKESDDKGHVGEMGGLAVYEQSFVDVVRSTGGRNAYRCLVIQAPYTNTDNYEKFGSMPVDKVSDRLMGEVHFYPWLFTLKEEDSTESWGWMKFFWGKDNKEAAEAITKDLAGHPGKDRWDSTSEEDIISELERIKGLYCDKGYPVILGEYGAIMDRDKFLTANQTALNLNHKSRNDFNYFVAKEAFSRGIIPFLWDTGEAVTRRTGEISKDYLLPPVINGVNAATFPF